MVIFHWESKRQVIALHQQCIKTVGARFKWKKTWSQRHRLSLFYPYHSLAINNWHQNDLNWGHKRVVFKKRMCLPLQCFQSSVCSTQHYADEKCRNDCSLQVANFGLGMKSATNSNSQSILSKGFVAFELSIEALKESPVISLKDSTEKRKAQTKLLNAFRN